MATTFITNQLLTLPSAIFLDGGSYSKNVMRNANIVATDDTGENYMIYYKDSYYSVPVSNVVQIITEAWIVPNHPVKSEWTELPVDYSTYTD
jgi:hypothetical protein